MVIIILLSQNNKVPGTGCRVPGGAGQEEAVGRKLLKSCNRAIVQSPSHCPFCILHFPFPML